LPSASGAHARTGRGHRQGGRWRGRGSALVDLVAKHGADAAGPVKELTAALAAAVHSARKEIA
jgi:hypothetical protein